MAFYIFLAVCVILNAIIGYLAFEWAWKQLKPLREVDEARDSQFPVFRRTDVKKWDKKKFLFNAMTTMPFRFMVGIVTVTFLFVFIK